MPESAVAESAPEIKAEDQIVEAEPQAHEETQAPAEVAQVETPENENAPEEKSAEEKKAKDIVQALPEKIRLKIEEKAEEEEIPLSEVLEGYKLSRKHAQEIEEAREAVKTAQEIIEGLAKDPMGTLEEAFTGLYNGNRLQAQQELLRHIEATRKRHEEFQKLPEPERKLLTLQRQHAETLAELELMKKKEAEEVKTIREQEATRRVLNEIGDALKAIGLPHEQENIRGVAGLLYQSRQAGKPITAIEAAKGYSKHLESELEKRLKSLDGADPKALQGLFPNLIKKLREADLSDVRKAQSQRKDPSPSQRKKPEEKKVRVYRSGEWDELFK